MTLNAHRAILAAIILASAASGQAQWTPGPAGSTSYTSGNVAIGTTNATAPLTVVGNDGIYLNAPNSPYVNINWTTTAGQGGMVFRENGVTQAGFNMNGTGFSDPTRRGFLELVSLPSTGGVRFWTSLTPRMTIDGAGNVGIGSTTPSVKLQVNNDSSSVQPFVSGYDQGTALRIANYAGPVVNQFANLAFYNGGSQYAGAIIQDQLTATTGTGTHNLNFYVNNNAGWVDSTSAAMTIHSSGNVGLGTPNPGSKLHIDGGNAFIHGANNWRTPGDTAFTYYGEPTGGLAVGAKYNGGLIFSVYRAGNAGSFGTNYLDAVTISNNDGNVSIGSIPNPSYKLDVSGNMRVIGSLTAGSVIGAVYQDVAEWVPATEAMSAGTLVVLNPEKNNEVMPSTHAYDTMVAGVVSEHPGVILGVAGGSKAQVATTGRVKVYVDATRHSIKIGDLLVSSDRPGTAMYSEPVDLGGVKIHRPGTIIGKALEPLASGEGEILVLLSLQ